MKKFVGILILILILFFTGCGPTTQEVVIDPVEYLEPPTITFSTGYGYNDQNVLVDEQVEITEDSFEAVGRNIFLEIAFHSTIDVSAIAELIQLDGHDDYTVTGHRAKRNTIKLMARDVEYGKAYRLHIPSEIKDLAGLSLEGNIEIDIVMSQTPMVYYYYQNASGEQIALGDSSSNPENVHFTQPLIEDRVAFTLEFNTPIEQVLAEEAISKCFASREAVQFNWVGEQELELIIENLRSNYEYRVAFNKDTSDALILIGTLFFEYYEPTKLISYDLTTGQSEELKVFSDKPAMVIPGDSFEQNFIVDDYFNRYVMNPTEGVYKVIPDAQYAFGSRVYGWYSIWLDGEAVLNYDEEMNSLYLYNIVTGESRMLFTLPDAFDGQGSFDLRLSPDKGKIALTSGWATTGLYVYTLSGDLLYENTTITGWDARNDGSMSLGIQWLDNNTIIYDDCRMSIIRKLTVNTSVLELVLSEAESPVVSLDSKEILVSKKVEGEHGLVLFNIADEQVTMIETGWTVDPRFISEEIVAYSRFTPPDRLDIVIYNIITMGKQIIGEGRIIGKSADGTKIYFVKNYQDVYDMYRPS